MIIMIAKSPGKGTDKAPGGKEPAVPKGGTTGGKVGGKSPGVDKGGKTPGGGKKGK